MQENHEARDFTIYHVPDLKKVGCTRNFKKRCWERYRGLAVVVLEIIAASKGAEYAGDVEWDYADKFGYKRRSHYTNTWDFKLTISQRREYGALGSKGHSAEGRLRLVEAGKRNVPKGVARMDPEKAAEIAAKGAAANGRSPNNAFRQKLTCPTCGMIGNTGNMKRFHFDNCRGLAS